MATIEKFEDIDAWQRARELTREIYSCSGTGKFAKDFGLRDQIYMKDNIINQKVDRGFYELSEKIQTKRPEI